MSTQITQYLMYATIVEEDKICKESGEEWIDRMSEIFSDDSAYDTKIGGKDGIFWLRDGMSGEYSLVGKVFQKSSDGEPLAYGPLKIPTNHTAYHADIVNAVEKYFGITNGDFQVYLINHYS